MQHAAQQLGVPFARPLNVEDMRYIYDIEHRSGLAMPTINIVDIEGESVFDGKVMGDTVICAAQTGACVSSATGGLIEGWDMYGQYVQETLALAGTSTIAFAGISNAPDDAVWENTFGLPYKYLADADPPPTDVTFNPADEDGDARGTFEYAGIATQIVLSYIVDQTQPFGASYASRFASPERIADVTFVGTINTAGAIAITRTLIADGSQYQFISMPDGQTVRLPNAAGVSNYTLSPLWRSQYADTIDNLDTLVTGVTEAGTKIIVDLTGSISGTPVIVPPPPPPPPLPASFTSHAQADAWLDAFTASLGIGEPLDWTSMTLAEKHAAATALVAAIP